MLGSEFLVSKALVDGAQFKTENDRFYQQYRDGQLDVASYLAFSCAPLARIPRQTLEILHSEFMATVIEPIILPKGRALIAGASDARRFCHGDYRNP